MKDIFWQITLALICNNVDTIIPIAKRDFEIGRKATSLTIDKKIAKKGNTLRLNNCKALKDNNAENDFFQYEYTGSINEYLPVVKKTTYNGESYLIANTKDCKTLALLGSPFVIDSLIINFNESETTDRRNVIEVRKLRSNLI